MKKPVKKYILVLSSLFVFAILNYSIYQKEQIKKNGEVVFLELAPADPRSLMQGDYMQLNYDISNRAVMSANKENPRGYLVIRIDENKVGQFRCIYDGKALALGEKLIRYYLEHRRIHIAPDSFMFQEGHAEHYQRAKYGIFKFDNDGNYLLVGLADEKRQRIQA
jgi:uncharacterized membrane-anchored protein